MSVKAEGVFQGLEIGALFQEGFLQTVSTCMEILLNEETKALVTKRVKHPACSYGSVIHHSLNLKNHPFIVTEQNNHIKEKVLAVTVGSNSGIFATRLLLLSSTFRCHRINNSKFSFISISQISENGAQLEENETRGILHYVEGQCYCKQKGIKGS